MENDELRKWMIKESKRMMKKKIIKEREREKILAIRSSFV